MPFSLSPLRLTRRPAAGSVRSAGAAVGAGPAHPGDVQRAAGRQRRQRRRLPGGGRLTARPRDARLSRLRPAGAG